MRKRQPSRTDDNTGLVAILVVFSLIVACVAAYYSEPRPPPKPIYPKLIKGVATVTLDVKDEIKKQAKERKESNRE